MASPDITEAIPTDIGGRTNPKSAIFRITRDAFDIAFGDLPFRLANSVERLYERSTAPIRKEQFDADRNVGEQSLDGWWLRSQSDFSGGMGVTFYEPLLGEGSETRFIDSRGLNVFDHDDVRLLNEQAVARSGGTDLEFVGIGESVGLYRTGAEFRIVRADRSTTVVTPFGTNPKGIARIPGFNWLIGHSTGIGRMSSTGSSTSVVTGASAALVPYWAKDRIFAVQGRKVFELTLTGGVINETDEGPHHLITHPTSFWSWVSIVETGSAVWLAGRASTSSAVYVTTVGGSGETPVLTAPAKAIELPTGEYVTAMQSYLDFLLICTNLGFRIAITDGDRAQLGPLLWRDEPGFSVAARGDFAWVGLGNGLTRRVALGITTSPDELDFAYANDASVINGGNVTAIGYIADRLTLAVNDVGVAVETDNLIESGWLRVGFARYGTLEPKFYESALLLGDVSVGSLSLAAATTLDAYSEITTQGGWNGSREIGLNLPGGSPPWEKLSLQITLNRDTTTTGPTFEGYQLRALPAPARRQEMFSIPISLYDREAPRWGTKIGGDGFAYARFADLKALEESGVPVIMQDFRTGEARSVVIDQVSFENNTPPDRHQSNFGGVATIIARAVA